MPHRLLCRAPRHTTVVAYLALFVALGGSSYAAVSLKAGSVGSRELRNGSVRYADLAKDARPGKENARFRAAVADVVADPASQINIRVVGEKGDKGDAGLSGTDGQSVKGDAGPAGATGGRGPEGVPGAPGPTGPAAGLRVFGTVTPTSVNVQGAVVHHPGNGVYCVQADGVTALSVTPDTPATTPFIQLPRDDSEGSCPRNQWTVVVASDYGADSGFQILGS